MAVRYGEGSVACKKIKTLLQSTLSPTLRSATVFPQLNFPMTWKVKSAVTIGHYWTTTIITTVADTT